MPIFSPGLCGCLILLVGWVFDSRRLRQNADIIEKTVISNIDGPSLSTSVIHKIAKRGMKMGFSVSTATNPSYMYQTPSGYIFRLRIPKDLRALMATSKYPTRLMDVVKISAIELFYLIIPFSSLLQVFLRPPSTYSFFLQT